MSKKNNPRRARNAARSAARNVRNEERREQRLDRSTARFIEVFSTVAPVAERMSDKLLAFAASEAGALSAQRADALLRDAAASELGQRFISAAIRYVERGFECEASEGEARSEVEVARIRAEVKPKPEPEPVVEPEPAPEPEPKPEPKPVSKRRKIELTVGERLSEARIKELEARIRELEAAQARRL